MNLRVSYFSNQFAQRASHGIGRYSRHLFDALQKYCANHTVIPVAAWTDLEAQELIELKDQTDLKVLPSGRRLTPLLWKYLGWPKLESLVDQPDLVHLTSLGYPVATRKPLMVTIHDIGPLTHPEYFDNKPSWIMESSLRQAVDQADHVTCVSQATADEVTFYVKRKYGLTLDDRMSVIHEGVSPYFFQEPELSERVPSDSSRPFILSVGKISPRKNLKNTLLAYQEVSQKVPHELIIVGGDGWSYDEIYSMLRGMALEDRVKLLGHVSDGELRSLYRRATCYVYPSLYEGFGLTILESMAAACPVVTSNISSMPEVAGDAALLCDPFDVNSLAAGILELCQNDQRVAEMKEKGRQHASQFTWEKTAREVGQIYEQIG